MDIRVFEQSDIIDIVRLTNLYAAFDSKVNESDFQPAWSFPQGLLIADIDGQVVGFIFAYLRDIPREVLNKWAVSKVAQIEILVVMPSYRGQGIGENLLKRLLDVLEEEGVDLILLHCPAESIEAKQLYDKFGFEVRAYAMKKQLQ